MNHWIPIINQNPHRYVGTLRGALTVIVTHSVEIRVYQLAQWDGDGIGSYCKAHVGVSEIGVLSLNDM